MSARITLFSQPPTPVIATLVVVGWRRAAHAADLDAVVTQVGQRGSVQVCGHVGVEVGGVTDLVEKLSCDGVSGDGAAGARVLGDH